MSKHLWEIKHPYHMTEGNYYQAGCHSRYNSWHEFNAVFGDSDLDYNWVVRWDWLEDEGEYSGDDYYRHARFLIQMIGQRKALLQSFAVSVCRADEPAILEFLKPRWEYMKTMWEPFSPPAGGSTDEPEGGEHVG